MFKPAIFILATSFAASSADAQMTAPSIVSAIPDMNSVGASNAAGVLQYCMSKDLVSSASTGPVLDHLRKQPGLTSSADFAAGASGEIRGSKRFSIPRAPGFLQSQACDLVQKRGKILASRVAGH